MNKHQLGLALGSLWVEYKSYLRKYKPGTKPNMEGFFEYLARLSG